MTKEEKRLLFQDLCARLPYGVVVQEPDFYEAPLTIPTLSEVFYDGLEVKPYLRPMLSMTKEEYVEYSKLWDLQDEFPTDADIQLKVDVFDWLNAHHFDYRGLIEKDLALEAPEGMYNLNNE